MSESGPVIAHSSGAVAMWLGVTTKVVSGWIVRHWEDIPEPGVVILTPAGDEVYGWRGDQRADWEAWFKNRAGTAPNRRKRPRHYGDPA